MIHKASALLAGMFTSLKNCLKISIKRNANNEVTVPAFCDILCFRVNLPPKIGLSTCVRVAELK